MKKILLLLLLSIGNTFCFDSIQAIILAAGRSSRFDGPISKLATPVCGTPMVLHPIRVAAQLQIPITLVLGYQKELIQEIVSRAGYLFDFVIQEKQMGTGHALQCSATAWQKENILVLNGDMPMVEMEHIKAVCEKHLQENADITFAISYNVDPDGAFGRIVTNENGTFIVEKKEFTGTYQEYPMVNSGIYIFSRSYLEKYMHTLERNKKTNEYNITDLVNMANNLGVKICTTCVPYHFGANTKEDVEKVETTYTQKEQL